MLFAIKLVLSASIISFASWLAGRKPLLAGFIVALPLTSMLSLLFSYAEYRDMEKINQFAKSIFLFVPLSLVFFIPFLLNKWMKTGFMWTYLLGLMLLAVGYGLYRLFGGNL
jgi:hypothetical protein